MRELEGEIAVVGDQQQQPGRIAIETPDRISRSSRRIAGGSRSSTLRRPSGSRVVVITPLGLLIST